MTDQQPSKLKAWAQIQLGKALFKVYQVKTAWASRLAGSRHRTASRRRRDDFA